MISESDVLKALSNVDDPDLHKDIVTLGMVKNLEIIGNKVAFDLELTTPACPMKDMIVNACKTALNIMVSKDVEPAIRVTSRVTTSRQASETLSGVKNIIAVASGKGGVGKSTVSSALAIALSEAGATVGLLDADIYGPSIPTIFGVFDSPAVREENGRQIMIPVEKNGVKLLSIGMITNPDQAVVWRGPMISSAFRQFISDVDWGHLDYLIIDLPPGTGDVQLTLSQLVPLTGVVIVTTPQEVALSDARRAINMFKLPAIGKQIIGIVENMSFFIPPDAPDKCYYIFGQNGGRELALKVGVPFLGQLPLLEKLRKDSDAGDIDSKSESFRPFSLLAEEVARQVSILNSEKMSNFA